jgi:hypothetical protein
MTVDFAKLGKTTLGAVPAPPKEPAGTYHGVVRSWKWAESRFKDQETGQPDPQVHITIKPTEFEGDLPPTIRLANLLHTAEIGARSEDELMFRVQELARNLGVTLGRSADEILPDCIGAQVTYEVVLKAGDRGEFVNIRRLRARAAA